MTPNRHGSTVFEFPDPLTIVATRKFDAPMQLIFDVFTVEEHIRKTFPPFDETMSVCSIDLRVGGDYHYVMVTPDGIECSFRGSFLEVEPPLRTVQTWQFDGWPGVQAVETMALSEADGVTTLTYTLRFPDQAGRDHMTKFDGHEAQFDKIEDYVAGLTSKAGDRVQ